jgi:hypothetical protein
MRPVFLALVHYPVLDREQKTVTTAITNLDLHDLGRSARTYGLGALYVVHPVAAQRELAERVRSHWVTGSGARRIPDRRPAMEILRVVPLLEHVVEELGGRHNLTLWTTGATLRRVVRLSHQEARAELAHPGPPVLLLFGTGWGLAEEVFAQADAQLDPIRSLKDDGYNHLSVRAAAAITLDRLLGEAD